MPDIVTTFINDIQVAQTLCEGIPLEDRDDFVRDIVAATHESEERTRGIVKATLLVEYRTMCERREPHSFLRSNKAPSLILDAVAKRDIIPGLRTALQRTVDLMTAIPALPDEWEYSAAPSPTTSLVSPPDDDQTLVSSGDSEDQDPRVTQILVALDNILTSVIDIFQSNPFPSSTRRGVDDFVKILEGLVGPPLDLELDTKVVVERALVAFACLRVVAPLLANPQTPTDSTWTAADRRRFTLVAKVFQKAANRSTFGQPPLDGTSSLPPSNASLNTSMSVHSPTFLAHFDSTVSKFTDPLHSALRRSLTAPDEVSSSDQGPSADVAKEAADGIREQAERNLARLTDMNARRIALAACKMFPFAPLVDVSVMRSLGVWRRGAESASRLLNAGISSPTPKTKSSWMGTFKGLFGRPKSPPPSRSKSTEDVAETLDASFASGSSGMPATNQSLSPFFLDAVVTGCRTIDDGVEQLDAVLEAAFAMQLVCPSALFIYEEGLRRAQRLAEPEAMNSSPDSKPADPSNPPSGSSTPQPRGQRLSSREHAVVSHLVARLWVLLGALSSRSGHEDHLSIVFMSCSKGSNDRRDWGANWLASLLDEFFPEHLTELIDKFVVVKPTFFGKLARRFSLAGKRESIESRICNVDKADGVVELVKAKRFPLPIEHLPKTVVPTFTVEVADLRENLSDTSRRYMARVLSVCQHAHRIPSWLAKVADSDAASAPGTRCDVPRDRELHSRVFESTWADERPLVDDGSATVFLSVVSQGDAGRASAALLDVLRFAAERVWPSEFGWYSSEDLAALIRGDGNRFNAFELPGRTTFQRAILATIGQVALSCASQTTGQAVVRSALLSRYAESPRGRSGVFGTLNGDHDHDNDKYEAAIAQATRATYEWMQTHRGTLSLFVTDAPWLE